LILAPDFMNKFDRDAMKVLRLNGEQLGFLEADLALEIKSRLQRRTLVEAKISAIREGKENIKTVTLELQRYSVKEAK
jgi:hypothetical protein